MSLTLTDRLKGRLRLLPPLCIALPLAIRIKSGFPAMPPPIVRSLELQPWCIADFVSPVWIGLGLVWQVLALTCAVVVYLVLLHSLELDGAALSANQDVEPIASASSGSAHVCYAGFERPVSRTSKDRSGSDCEVKRLLTGAFANTARGHNRSFELRVEMSRNRTYEPMLR